MVNRTASVAVENTTYGFDKPFDYLIPENLKAKAKPGCRVMISFGKGTKNRQGMILSVEEKTSSAKLKPILAVLDKSPLLSGEMLLMVSWIKQRYFCTLFEAVRLLLPAGITFRIHKQYEVSPTFKNYDRADYTDLQWQILSYLIKQRKPVPEPDFLAALGLSADAPDLQELRKSGAVLIKEGISRKVGDLLQKMVRVCEPLPDNCKLSVKQQEVYRILLESGEISVKELCYFAGVTESVVKALEKKGGAEFFECEVYRIPYNSVQKEPTDIVLSEEQLKAYNHLMHEYTQRKGGTSLLYGVTGSGKTAVYMRLIDEVYREKRGIIVMVPEISLTPQTIAIFQKRYGKDVAVFHSALSVGERLDEWKRIKNGDACIAIGTRSAVFAPFQDIGLIIMDEEQEYTYKSDRTPRYQTKDIVKFRCAYHKALCVLSSATPSIESFYAAQIGKFSFNKLSCRYGEAQLPQVHIVDMNEELLKGNTSILSLSLQKELHKTMEAGKQSILLLNRRGYHTFAICRACKEVVTCPSCSISLTYHSANNRLVCHYCGYSMPLASQCPHCHETALNYTGIGTQKAEEQIQQCLPNARILRLDADSTMTRFSYDKKLNAFRNGEYDLIVGTQMVAKGLDFENVTLVGVLNADQTIYSDDFRSNERAFDLLTQVVGRSGRGRYSGMAIIQTATPENAIIHLAAKQDYGSFYEQEIAFRKAMLYPPFSDIVVIGFVGANEARVQKAAEAFFLELQIIAKKRYSDLPLRMLSPSPAAVFKVSNKFRYKLIIKCRNNLRFREMLSYVLTRYFSNRSFADVSAFVDCNPENIL